MAFQRGINWVNSLKITYKSKKPRKDVNLNAENIHQEMYKEVVDMQNALMAKDTATTNFLSCKITFILSNIQHKKGGEHNRISITLNLAKPDQALLTYNDLPSNRYSYIQNVERRISQEANERKEPYIFDPIEKISAHTEQMLYEHILSNTGSIVDNLINELKIKKIHHENIKIYAIVLHLHSTFPVCKACEYSSVSVQKELVNEFTKALQLKKFSLPKKHPIRLTELISISGGRFTPPSADAFININDAKMTHVILTKRLAVAKKRSPSKPLTGSTVLKSGITPSKVDNHKYENALRVSFEDTYNSELKSSSESKKTPVSSYAPEVYQHKKRFSRKIGDDTQHYDDRTYLHHASEDGLLSLVKPLVDAGADVNAHDACGLAPMQLAAFNNKGDGAQIIKTLHAHGAKYHSRKPLFLVVKSDSATPSDFMPSTLALGKMSIKDQMLDLLLEAKEKETIKWISVRTIELSERLVDCASSLMSMMPGKDQNKKFDGMLKLEREQQELNRLTSAFDLFMQLHHPIKIYLHNAVTVASLNAGGNYSELNTILFDAIKHDNVNNIIILLSNGFEVNFYSNDGHTPLHYALSLRRYNIAKILINHGADVNSIITFPTFSDINKCVFDWFEYFSFNNEQDNMLKILVYAGAHPQQDSLSNKTKNLIMKYLFEFVEEYRDPIFINSELRTRLTKTIKQANCNDKDYRAKALTLLENEYKPSRNELTLDKKNIFYRFIINRFPDIAKKHAVIKINKNTHFDPITERDTTMIRSADSYCNTIQQPKNIENLIRDWHIILNRNFDIKIEHKQALVEAYMKACKEYAKSKGSASLRALLRPDDHRQHVQNLQKAISASRKAIEQMSSSEHSEEEIKYHGKRTRQQAFSLSTPSSQLYQDLMKEISSWEHQVDNETSQQIDNDEQLTTHLSSLSQIYSWGFKPKNPQKTGNAFFHAMADELREHKIQAFSGITEGALRDKLANHILTNFSSYCASPEENLHDYIKKFSIDKNRADNQILLALSRALNVTIIIIKDNDENPRVFKPSNPLAKLYFGCLRGRYCHLIAANLDDKPKKSIDEFVKNAPVNDLIDSLEGDEKHSKKLKRC